MNPREIISMALDHLDIYRCPDCHKVWTSDTGRECICDSDGIRLDPAELLAEIAPPPTAAFRDQVIAFERGILRQALIDNGKNLRRTAIALGFFSHQTFIALLKARHPDLREELGIAFHSRRKKGK